MKNKVLVYKPKKTLILPHNEAVLSSIPRSKEFSYKGKILTQVYHGEKEVSKLAEMGIKAPAPIQSYYKWPLVDGKYVPYSHQKETADFFTLNSRGVCLNGMGTGKTCSTLYAADYFLNQKEIKKILILAPLSCLQKVWMDALFNSFHWRNGVVVHGSKVKRLKSLNEDVEFYIANHEFLRTIIDKKEIGSTYKYFLNSEYDILKDFDVIVVDEYSFFRNASTYNYHALEVLLEQVNPKYFWPLTGTPCPNAPTDAWALARLLNKKNVDKYFGSFKRRVMMEIGGGPYPKWIPRQGSHEIVNEVLQPAIRFKKDDCLDLPPITFQDRECSLTASQKKHYKSMKQEMTLLQDGQEISAVNAADRMIKLRQILCGSIKANEDEYMPLDCKPRINLVLELIEEAGHKAILIAPFKGILRMLKKEIGKHYTCEIVNGDVKKSKRDQIFTNFQTTKDPHILLCHPRVMAHGLTLTKANYVIFYAPIDSSDYYEQVTERINRPGQVNNMSIVHISAHPIEELIYRGLKERKNFQSMALELYNEEFN